MKNRGWKQESHRHSLARKGVRTTEDNQNKIAQQMTKSVDRVRSNAIHKLMAECNMTYPEARDFIDEWRE